MIAAVGCSGAQEGRLAGTGLGLQRIETPPVSGDLDGDGLDDDLEDALAEHFAPIVFHGEEETTFPTKVDRWLTLTDLYFVDGQAAPRLVVRRPLTQAQLLGHSANVGGLTVSSDGSRSRGKRVSFVLGDVAAARDTTPLQPDEWVTYVHSHPNTFGGVTLQYWRAYVRNDASLLGIDFSHGGDWEAIAVHLDADQQPVRVTCLDHAGIVDVNDCREVGRRTPARLVPGRWAFERP